MRAPMLVLALLLGGCEAPAAKPPQGDATGAPAVDPRPAGARSSDVSPEARPAARDHGGDSAAYPWPRAGGYTALSERVAAPAGAQRVELAPGSYGAWLRNLPVRPEGTPVTGYHGRTILEGDDRRLFAVVDLDLIGADLQQCADTIMRVRAEYLRATGAADEIAFHFVSGFEARWADYRRGTRVRLVDEGRRVEPFMGARADDSRETFVRYLTDVFSYASTVSLAREARPVEAVAVGDFFILPGGPGHTVLVVDLARGADGSLFALLAQGFMPAQDLHVLRASRATPWYRLVPGEPVDTPMWEPFPWSSLRRLD